MFRPLKSELGITHLMMTYCYMLFCSSKLVLTRFFIAYLEVLGFSGSSDKPETCVWFLF